MEQRTIDDGELRQWIDEWGEESHDDILPSDDEADIANRILEHHTRGEYPDDVDWNDAWESLRSIVEPALEHVHGFFPDGAETLARYVREIDMGIDPDTGEDLERAAIEEPAFRTSFRIRAMAGADPEKIARVKAALAAKAKKAEQEAEAAKPQVFDEQLEAKLAAMDPEKAAKVRTAMARKAKLADMDPEKAAQVRGALTNEAKLESQRAVGQQTPQKQAELEAKLAQLDPERAAKVRAALDARARQETAKAEHDEKVAVLEERLKNMDPEKAARVRAAFLEKQRAAGAGADGKAGE